VGFQRVYLLDARHTDTKKADRRGVSVSAWLTDSRVCSRRSLDQKDTIAEVSVSAIR
jgi:hypothetical protein